MGLIDRLLKRSTEWTEVRDQIDDLENDMIAALAILDGLEPDDPDVPDDDHQGVLWEPYLNEINAKVEFVSGARYQLVAAWHTENGQWDGVPEYAREYITVNGGGGETHAFAIVYQKDGKPLVGKSVLLSWPGGEDGGVTWDDGSVNFFTPGKYYPDQGQTGPYSVQVLNGDILHGAGLPYGQHVSIFGVWRERADYEPTGAEIDFAEQCVVSGWTGRAKGYEAPFTMIVSEKSKAEV